jgi:hypothetical protein
MNAIFTIGSMSLCKLVPLIVAQNAVEKEGIPGSDNFSGLGIIPANHYVVKICDFPNFFHNI